MTENGEAARPDIRVALKRIRNDLMELERGVYQLIDRVERLEVEEAERRRKS